MLYDRNTDYSNYMPEVINAYTKNMLLNGDMQKLTTIINSGEYNRDMYDVIINSNTDLAGAFKMVYGE